MNERSRDYGRGRDAAPSRDRGGRDDPPVRRRAVADAVAPGRGVDRGQYGGRDRDEGRAPERGGRDRGGRDAVPARRSSYEYRERTREAVERRAKMGNSDFDKIVRDGVRMWTPADGENTVRILPPTWEGAQHYGLDLQVHYGIGPDRQSYLCMAKMEAEVLAQADRLQRDNPELADKLRASAGRCPICEERALAKRDGDDDYAKELDARRRVLVYIVDRDDEKEGLQVWAMPRTVDEDLAKVGVHKRTGAVLPIDHPDIGYDVEFEKEGKGINTKYKGLAIARDESPLGNDDWLIQAEDAPLPTVLEFHDYDYIAKVFGAGAGPARDDPPARGRDDRDAPAGRGRDDARGGGDRGGGGRGDAERGRGDARGAAAPAADPTWDEVHAMDANELDKLALAETKLDPASFGTDEELADAICDEMGIPQPRRRAEPDPAPSGGRERLADMRRGR